MKKVIQIEIPLGSPFPKVNVFIIPHAEGIDLVDAGKADSDNWEIFCQSIEDYGFTTEDIRNVFLTHQHQDHVGFLPQLIEESSATIHAPLQIKDWLTDFKTERLRQIQFHKQLFSEWGMDNEVSKAIAEKVNKMSRVPFEYIDLNRVSFFEDQSRITIADESFIALNTPGHCKDQYCFIHHKNEFVFGGDMLLPLIPYTIVEEKGETQRTTPLLDLLASFEKLQKYFIPKVYPGHGKAFLNANEVIEDQKSRIYKRTNECYDHIKSGVNTLIDLVNIMYPQHHPHINTSGLFITAGYLDLLKTKGKIIQKGTQYFIDENNSGIPGG